MEYFAEEGVILSSLIVPLETHSALGSVTGKLNALKVNCKVRSFTLLS